MIINTLKSKLICLFLLTATLTFGQSNTSALLPLPNHIEQMTGKKNFAITPKTIVKTNLPEQAFCLAELQRILSERLDWDIPIKKLQSNAKSVIELCTDPTMKGEEHYTIEVSENKLSIKGNTQKALFYGLKTLDQILLGDVCNTANRQIAPIRIDDEPRYGYRALMLDPARHFLPLKDVKFYIDQMARYKYNTLQLHLTDDQGWRIEIKAHPGLTKTGAFRNRKTGPNGPDNGFYTQEQLKEKK